jgi:hypothetical protein
MTAELVWPVDTHDSICTTNWPDVVVNLCQSMQRFITRFYKNSQLSKHTVRSEYEG